MRKRYLRRSTRIAGHGTPFTRMTSPNSPEWSRSSKISEPSGGEHRVLDDEWHVVGAARQPEAPLQVVVQLVHGREAEVGVLRRDADSVVVVPERARGMVVRVVVVLPLPGLDDVAGVAVVFRQRGRPVQVHRRIRRVAERRMHRRERVDLLDDDRPVPLRHDRRAWRDAVVAEDRRLLARQDLDQGLLLDEAVVVGRRVRPHRRQHGRGAEGQTERRRQAAGRHAVRAAPPAAPANRSSGRRRPALPSAPSLRASRRVNGFDRYTSCSIPERGPRPASRGRGDKDPYCRAPFKNLFAGG